MPFYTNLTIQIIFFKYHPNDTLMEVWNEYKDIGILLRAQDHNLESLLEKMRIVFMILDFMEEIHEISQKM
jgi:hypothetical protein